MGFLEHALKLAEMGFHVFPLMPNSKTPVILDYKNQATTNPEQIKKFWLDPVMGTEKPYNIGISTTRYNGSQALVVVDIDTKNGKDGFKEILKLEFEGRDFKPTLTQKTPSGGQHLIYKAKAPVKQGSNVLGDGLDIRSQGGYIAAVGSIIDGKSYEMIPGELAPCPDWIEDYCGKVSEKVLSSKNVDINTDAAAKRVQFYLQNEAPLAIEGEGGDETTFKVAAKVKDYGVSELDAYNLMLEFWNDRCVPTWSPEQLKAKVANAYRYGTLPIGASAPEMQFTEVKDKESSFLEDINKDHALVFIQGKPAIIYQGFGPDGSHRMHTYTREAFKVKYENKIVQQGRGPARSYADLWLSWSGRREYEGICFSPEKDPGKKFYNVWRGFSCRETPYESASIDARNGFDAFIKHVKENICENDASLFDYLISYFAHLMQKPYDKPLVTLVFRGEKGVGKNAAIDRIAGLLGGHAMTAHSARYLDSNFNSHIEGCLLLTLDEAFWSGDKRADSALKSLTTGNKVLIERKGFDPYVVDNFLRIVIIGNEEWLVPASKDERRYAVFTVGNAMKNHRKFFHDMRINIDQKGGNEVLLHYLKNYKITVDINAAPITKGLAEQKLESLDLFEQFWFECLSEGMIAGSEFGDEWPTTISKQAFRDCYYRYSRSRNSRGWNINAEHISRRLLKLCPQINTEKRVKKLRMYEMPTLEVARKAWVKNYGHLTEWF